MKVVRCAIYTRKSSDEGLEQDFNSLDAQREACAAYILSQASEGWQLIPERYDDGGISGGTLERPALQQLLADVAAGKIDIIVIYKIDRLTRSLLDFAKLVEAFEKVGTSFVSVTQSFNTTTSMGRLTLNMLLSFAQFEREVTAERIRDKLAASKAKGMWMGGVPPLGYKPDGRSLAIVEPHAELVRNIYARYLRLGNVRLVADELKAEAILIPPRKLGTGRKLGGGAFTRGQIYRTLANPIYAGNIGHHGKISQGNHPAIIEQDEWNKVQHKLAGHVKGVRGSRAPTRSPLAGIIHDPDGQPMLASHTRKGATRYRYYVSRPRHLREAGADSTGLRVPAPEIEKAVASELARLFDDPLDFAERTWLVVEPSKVMAMIARCSDAAGQLREDGLAALPRLLDRVALHETRLDLQISSKAMAELLGLPLSPLAQPTLLVTCELRLTRTGQLIRLVQDNGRSPYCTNADAALVQHVVRAQKWWAMLRTGAMTATELAEREKVTASYVTRVVRAAFLAPAVVDAILAGRQRLGINVRALLQPDAIPDDWARQAALFGGA